MELSLQNAKIQITNLELESFIKELQMVDLEYSSAIKEVETKIEIFRTDFQIRYNYNPIEHVESRIKTPESLLNKMVKNNVPINIKAAREQIQDLAGVRIVCSFIPDIYKMVKMLKNNTNFYILKEKDYIKNPKPSGYRGYHVIVKVPVYLTTGVSEVIVEIQIRTMAMDFWAALEHKIKYKFNGYIPEYVKDELFDCSITASDLDYKMSKLKDNVDDNNVD